MADDLWALTLHQPWATAVIWAGKNVENRTWPTKYRGPLLIHASKHPPKLGDYLAIQSIHGAALQFPDPPVPLGVIIGVVDLVGCHLDAECWHLNDRSRVQCCTPWAQRDMWHFKLANPRPFAHPVPAIGKRRAWKVTSSERAAVLEQMPSLAA